MLTSSVRVLPRLGRCGRRRRRGAGDGLEGGRAGSRLRGRPVLRAMFTTGTRGRLRFALCRWLHTRPVLGQDPVRGTAATSQVVHLRFQREAGSSTSFQEVERALRVFGSARSDVEQRASFFLFFPVALCPCTIA